MRTLPCKWKCPRVPAHRIHSAARPRPCAAPPPACAAGGAGVAGPAAAAQAAAAGQQRAAGHPARHPARLLGAGGLRCCMRCRCVCRWEEPGAWSACCSKHPGALPSAPGSTQWPPCRHLAAAPLLATHMPPPPVPLQSTISLHSNPITPDVLEATEGYETFEARRQQKVSKGLVTGVLLGPKQLEQPADRPTARGPSTP